MPLKSTSSDVVSIVTCICSGPCSAATTFSSLPPSEVLKLAAAGPPNSCIVAEVVNEFEDSPNYARYAVLSLLLKLIKKVVRSPAASGKDLQWFTPVHGLGCLITSPTLAKRFDQGVDPLVRQFHDILPSLISTIWKNFKQLEGRDYCLELIRGGLIMFFCALAERQPFRRYLTTAKCIDIIWFCYLETPHACHPSLPDCRFRIVSLVGCVFTSGDIKDVLKTVHSVAPLETVGIQLNGWLRAKKSSDSQLAEEIRTIKCILGKLFGDPSILVPLLATDVHVNVFHALWKHIRRQDADTALEFAQTATVMLMLFIGDAKCGTVVNVLYDVLSRTPFLRIMIKMIEPTPASRSASTDHIGVWLDILRMIQHIARCREKDCLFHGSPAFLDMARHRIGMVYLQAKAQCHRLSLDDTRVPPIVDEWTRMGRILGLTDASIRECMKLGRKCCNVSCPNGLEPQGSKKYLCSRCGLAVYCDRACQKMDWVLHKTDCNPCLFPTEEKMLMLCEDDCESVFESSHVWSTAVNFK